MDRKKILSALIALVLPVALYSMLFWPFNTAPVKSLRINYLTGGISFLISSVQLAITLFVFIKLRKLSVKKTGLFSFRAGNLLNIISGILLVEVVYILVNICLFLIKGSDMQDNQMAIRLDAPVWVLAVMMLGVGYCEEFFFRVYMPMSMEEYIGRLAAMLISAVLFALGHLYEGLLAVIIIFFIGLIFNFIYCRYRNIHVNAIVHALFNVIAVILGAYRNV